MKGIPDANTIDTTSQSCVRHVGPYAYDSL